MVQWKIILLAFGLLCLFFGAKHPESTLGAKPLLISKDSSQSDWKPLLENDFARHWEVFIGVPHATVQDLTGVDPESDGKNGKPLGLGSDPKKVFAVEKENGQNVLHVSGEIYGAWTTKRDYENYHFQLQFKWGEQVWEPRLDRPRDSGILFHCQGSHGAFWNVWMASLEFQVQEGDLGDFYSLVDTEATIKVVKPEGQKEFDFDPEGMTRIFSAIDKKVTLHCNKGFDNENPHGQWNTLDLVCIGDQARFIVNGQVVMAVNKARHQTPEGMQPLTSGKIQIQSEGAEIFYKEIQIKQLPSNTLIDEYIAGQ